MKTKKTAKRRHVLYCVAINSADPPYVRRVWSDGDVDYLYPGEPGYKSAHAAAMRSRK